MNRMPIFLQAGFSPENLSLAGKVLLRGMGTVFLVLGILCLVIFLFGLFGRKAAGKKSPEDVSPDEAEGTVKKDSDEGHLIAAIMAAIEAYRASQGSGMEDRPYRVVSFRKRSDRKHSNTED